MLWCILWVHNTSASDAPCWGNSRLTNGSLLVRSKMYTPGLIHGKAQLSYSYPRCGLLLLVSSHPLDVIVSFAGELAKCPLTWDRHDA